MKHLFDCNTVNPGDVSIGQVMKEHLGLEQGGPDAPDDDLFVIGGGHLLQPWSEEYYRGFRRQGDHILYSVGVSGGVGAPWYLGDYRMVSVRTRGDKRILRERRLSCNIDIWPCPANLQGIEPSNVEVRPGTIGIQFFYPGWKDTYADMFEPNKGHILTFPWRRSIRDETVDDLIGARELAEQLDGEVVPTGLSPGQYRDVIQQLDFFVCQSLHAAMWAFHSNVPFLVHNYHSKIAFWADERNLWDHVFSKTDQIPDMFVKKFTFDGDTAKRDIEQAHKGLERVCQLLS